MEETFVSGIIGGILGVLITCIVQNNVERRKMLYLDNKEKCGVLIEFIIETIKQTKNEPEDFKKLLALQEKFIQNTLIFGSYSLIKSWNKSREILFSETATVGDKIYSLENVLIKLRRGCGHFEIIPKRTLLTFLNIRDLPTK